MRRWDLGALFGIQRAVAAPGFRDPPPFSAHGTMPGVEGTSAAWAEWVECRYATSTLTSKVRGLFRAGWPRPGTGWPRP
jgi:hypothetical protein